MNKLILIFFFICTSSSCQTLKQDAQIALKKDLIDFLRRNGDINDIELNDYQTGKRAIEIVGVQNNTQMSDKHIDGIYRFNQTRTHSRIYFLIMENGSYTILNISSRKGLDDSIHATLDFCERKKYCVDITNDYISRLINIYYNINVYPSNRTDINCSKGINDTKVLP